MKENSLSHHPPRPCAQRTAARELWWSQKSLVGEVEERRENDGVKTKKKETLLFARLAVLFHAKLESEHLIPRFQFNGANNRNALLRHLPAVGVLLLNIFNSKR